ncbi:MAG: hypothetical protein JNL24_06685 [Bacteroidia bacterium]|nr:hypothetical protein [Bacteroidia bacterium]
MKRSILIITIFIITLFSCDYDYVPYFEAPKPQIELQDLPAYAYFKTGTYWIYKDSASGVEDSVYVFYDTVFQYHLGTGNAQAEGDYMQYEWHSHNFTDEYNYDYKIDYGFYGLASKLVGVERWKFKPGDYVGNSYMMSNIFDSNYPFGYYGSPGTIYFKEEYDSLNIGGNIIRNVVHFQDTENASENIFFPGYGSLNPRTDYYIAKNIGVVKIRITDHTQFNLINKMQYLARYHIIQ